MNSLFLPFASGHIFFVGMIVVAVACGLRLKGRGPIARSTLLILVIFGTIMVALAGTPLPWWLYSLWSCSLLVAIAVPRVPTVAIISLLSVVLCLLEIPHQRLPVIKVAEGQSVFVIGDSITAGIGRGERTWPAVLTEKSGISIMNLAEAGAKTKNALRQVKVITEPKSVVLVEIGGNDLLGPTTSAEFRAHLEGLLSALCEAEHSVVMFELPLPPFHHAFGRTQRQLASEYGVLLLPRSVLASVLCGNQTTSDGLHLSQKGHDLLAERLREMIASSR